MLYTHLHHRTALLGSTNVFWAGCVSSHRQTHFNGPLGRSLRLFTRTAHSVHSLCSTHSLFAHFARSVHRIVHSLCSLIPGTIERHRQSSLCKNRVSWLFLATVRSYTETNDQPTCLESLFARLFVHMSLRTYVTWSIHAETQPRRIVARSGLFHQGLLSN